MHAMSMNPNKIQATLTLIYVLSVGWTVGIRQLQGSAFSPKTLTNNDIILPICIKLPSINVKLHFEPIHKPKQSKKYFLFINFESLIRIKHF